MDVFKAAFRVAASAFALFVVVSAQQTTYIPPHLVRGDLPSLPGPMVVGGGEVMIEATIDQTGALTHPVVLRTTPPFTNLVLDAVSRWSFEPARATVDGRQTVVDGGVLIAAIYHPPTLLNGPTIGERSQDLASASSNAPYAVSTAAPSYPLQTQMGAVLLYEISLDEAGQVRSVRAVATSPPFDAAAKDALVQWKFRGATAKGRPVPSTAYVIFGFSQPVIPAR
jgi:outer membrane biosynthesis protein TonB